MVAGDNLARLSKLLLSENAAPRVLVLGGTVIGQGMENVLSHSEIEVIESDVSFGPRTALICDAHDIPFDDATFDGVIVEAVLEHVVDPYRCADEVYRVLKAGGMVYAETPFMQQVHAGRYDFTRFTHLGHRRLFRKFEEIDSGAACGPGMALAWSYCYFLQSFVRSPPAYYAMYVFACFTAFWLRFLDRFLIGKPGALDAASSYYFWGRKTDHVLSDTELIAGYRGLLP